MTAPDLVAYCLECGAIWTTEDTFREDRDATLRRVFADYPDGLAQALAAPLEDESVCPLCTHDLWTTPGGAA